MTKKHTEDLYKKITDYHLNTENFVEMITKNPLQWHHIQMLNELESRKGKSVFSKIGTFKKIPIYGRTISWSVIDDPLNWEARVTAFEAGCKLVKEIVAKMMQDWKYHLMIRDNYIYKRPINMGPISIIRTKCSEDYFEND